MGRNQGNVLYWARAYLGVKIYNTARSAGGGELPESDLRLDGSVVGCFPSLQERGVLRCPGSRLSFNGDWSSVATLTSFSSIPDYGITGFGPCGGFGGYGTYAKVFDYPRLTKIANGYNGSPVAFIIDNAYLSPLAAPRGNLYTQMNNHEPSNPQGINVCSGSGAVKWMDVKNLSAIPGENMAAPKGYYTQIHSRGNVDGPTLPTLNVLFNPSGNYEYVSPSVFY